MILINTVLNNGFMSLINILNRRHRIPSQSYFPHAALPKMYDTCRETMESDLSPAEHYTCATDLWSNRTTEAQPSLTEHFLKKSL